MGKDLIADAASSARLIKNATGGSTGVPLIFYQDIAYWDTSTAIDAYVRSWYGIRPYDRTAYVWGDDREVIDHSWRGRLFEWRSRRKMLNAFRMSEERIIEFVKMLKRWKPPYLMGYSSALGAFCQNR